MPNRFVETQYVTTKYDKNGYAIDTVVSKTLPFSSASVTAERRKKQEAIDKLQQLVDNLEISVTNANEIALIIKDYKQKKKLTHTRSKYKWVIAHHGTESKFKKSYKTDCANLSLLHEIVKDPKAWCIADNNLDKIKKRYREARCSICWQYTDRVVGLDLFANCMLRNVGKNHICPSVRKLYEKAKHNVYVPTMNIDDSLIDDIKRFIEQARRDAQSVVHDKS